MSEVIINTTSGAAEIVLAIEVVRPNVTISIEGMGGGGSGGTANPNAVLYTPQTLMESQQAQARRNIGAASVDDTTLVAYISQLADGRYIVDKDFSELYNAAIAGRSVELVDADSYNIHGALRYALTGVDYGVVRFECRIAHASYVCTLTDTDGRYVRRSTVELASPQDRLSNPNSLIFTGSENVEYDGSREVYVNVADNWQDLKGKPFGIIGKDGYVFGPADLPIGANGLSEFPIAFGIETGLEYVVTVDGVDYAATAQALPYGGQPAVMLGNPSFLQLGADNGLPFLLGTVLGQRMSAIGYPAKAGGVVQLAISGVPKLVRIPAEYLPESLGAVDKANAGKLLYVDANGALKAVTLGSGLQLVGGVLSVTGAVTPSVGTSMLGEAVIGDMILGG